MHFRVTCLIEYFIVELLIEESQYFLCVVLDNLIEFTLNPNSMIEIAPEL